jgi:hypothetical protein
MRKIQIINQEVQCPAADIVTGFDTKDAIFCRIEEKKIQTEGPQADLGSIKSFCCSEYHTCPTWRTHKETGMTQSENAAYEFRQQDIEIDRDKEILERYDVLGDA